MNDDDDDEYQAFLSKRVGVGRNCRSFLLLPHEKEKPDTQARKEYNTPCQFMLLKLGQALA